VEPTTEAWVANGHRHRELSSITKHDGEQSVTLTGWEDLVTLGKARGAREVEMQTPFSGAHYWIDDPGQ
jgi:hypothetical protein